MTDEPYKPDQPDYSGWSNEEIGAFIRGCVYVENGGDVSEIIEAERKRSPLEVDPPAGMGAPDGNVATATNWHTASPEEKVNTIITAADRTFRGFFGGYAGPVSHQLSLDASPFIELIEARIVSGGFTVDDMRALLLKMVVATSAGTIMAASALGRLK